MTTFIRVCYVGLAIAVVISLFDNETKEPISKPNVEAVKEVKAEPVAKVVEKVVDTDQMICLATNIYHEARGESVNGKFAVGNVTLNRVNHKNYPNTICGVVYQASYKENWKGKMVPRRHKCQFSWFCDGKSDTIVLKTAEGKIIKGNMVAWEESLTVASSLLKHDIFDNTYEATHYYNDKLADPHWATAYQKVAYIENHVFHKMGEVF
jgi:N-acetylmuramoyl-L-alanine amidase